MARKVHSFWRLVLGSLITVLGFAACRSSKKVQQGDDTIELYGPPPVKVEKRPIDKIETVYGGPPVRVVRKSE